MSTTATTTDGSATSLSETCLEPDRDRASEGRLLAERLASLHEVSRLSFAASRDAIKNALTW